MSASRSGTQRKLRAAIYCRISSDREGRELGVERQEADCRALAKRRGLTVVAVYIDNDAGASRKSKKPRPRYREMIRAARAGEFEVIASYTTGRLTRRPREHEDLIELAESRGIQFAYVASPSFDLNTASGREVARILAARDAGEAEDISERVIAAKAQAAEQGRWRGGPKPFGYESDGVTVNPAEAAEVLRMSNELLAGASLRSLARDLEARGVSTSLGGHWGPSHVRGMLQRARNAGLIEQGGVVIGPATWEAIVPEDTWRAVCALLAQPARRIAMTTARRWRGTGLYECGVCGSPLIATSVNARLRREGRTGAYLCKGRQLDDRSHVSRDAAMLDMFVDELIIAWLAEPAARAALRATSARDTRALHARLVTVRGRLDELASMFAEGEIDRVQLRTGTASLRAESEELEREIGDAARTSSLAGLVGVPDIRGAWEAADLDRQQAVIRAVIDHIRVLPTKRGRPPTWYPGSKWGYFDPEGVEVKWRAAD